MRIKRLDICGFKSFMERSVFTFDDGVTAIVGPNGCGKSNVVDAIRWVMGEQSAKNLRGRGMEDVIFNGSENRAPLNMAEVSLTFRVEDTDTLAPQYAGFPEITVTRRLFRNGDSEYLINKTPCRLLDITELFLGTGVGTKAYSIIEQGRVGLIVSSKPEDRRALIEEAAGISKYKSRRRAAERKMEYTQQNLLRVTDVVQELEKRLDSLARQAKKAEKYKKLKSEMREIELHAAAHRYLELHAEARMLKARIENASGEEKAALEKVRALEQEIEEKRLRLEADALDLQKLAETVHALDGQVQLEAQNLTHWRRERDEIQARLAEAESERAALSVKLAELAEAAQARETELLGLGGSWKEDEVAMGVANEELRRVMGLQTELSLRIDEERAALIDLASRLANHETNLVNLARQRAELEARREKIRAEVEALRGEEAQLEAARAEVAAKVDQTRQLALELAERKGAEEATLARTRQEFAENEMRVIALREELADKRSRLESLQEIQKAYEGFDRGVRAVMLKAGSEARQQGIFGLVADVVATTPKYEKAIEAALGQRLQHVVVESREKGLELVEHLKTYQEGRSTFLPVDSIRRAEGLHVTGYPVEGRPGILALAINEVQCEETIRPVVEALLGDVVIAEDLRAARAFAQSEGQGLTVVTLDGDVLHADGSITGGTLEGAAVGALQKKREITELEAEVQRVEAEYNDILTRHYGLQKQIGHTEGVLKGLAKNQHAEELNLATWEKDLHKAGEDLARLRDRIAALEREGEQLGASMNALAAEEEALRGEVAHGQTEKAAREDGIRGMAVELESLKQRAEALGNELTALRVKVAQNNERGDSARKELEQLRAQEAELKARAARLDETVKHARDRLGELGARISDVDVRGEAKKAELSALQADLEARRKVHGEDTQRVREQDAELREVRTRLDALTAGLSEISLRERELALELQHLVEGIRERHQAELAEEVHRYHLLPALPPEAQERLKELRSQVERMGEINLTAIDEHQELVGRYEFLSKQKADLEASLEQLKDAIVRINKTSRERFNQAFQIINEKFQQVFPRLFGGGRAGLALTEVGPGEEPGVEIMAQPPGKKLQSVNLLSGGEKALTAVSLIFAIFLIKPTPFCLLDEVDAPLDEGNVGRYNDMVKEMSKGSQFILITHNKRTMEIADTLYGVTMEEPGISKLVSVRMKEAVAANDNAAA
ncbi:MAG: chromosome segregation protein SMC [Myxococcaceae bacterium]|nr:chromosome segregation protein SMC [Myxococcaceae bacterium]